MMNEVFLLGNLTRNCEVKDLQTGPLIKFTIAINEKRGDQDHTEFINVNWFTKFPKAQEYLLKGRQVTIHGKLQTRTYETAQGEKRNETSVVAKKVQWFTPHNLNKTDSEMPF
jgi:single-strand DNA-binding protein